MLRKGGTCERGEGMEEKRGAKIYCEGGGCSAKLGMGALRSILAKLPKQHSADLLVGFSTSDDAAVYQINDTQAIVQTLDFFPPMVDDAYTFGQIAAANALSDVYAMGGEVKSALNIVCYPETEAFDALGEILRGGLEKVREAGGILCGGHSIADDGIKYGLSVTGVVHPKRIWRNVGAKPGDRLILTKALGTGIVMAARGAGEALAAHVDAAVASMTMLNRAACEVLRKHPVHACTDVTGFGLLGHLCEMMGGDVTARLNAQSIPSLPGAMAYAKEFLLTGAAQKNRNALQGKVDVDALPFEMQELLYDPQTSGGLLAALPVTAADEALAALQAAGVPAAMVGEVTKRKAVQVEVSKA